MICPRCGTQAGLDQERCARCAGTLAAPPVLDAPPVAVLAAPTRRGELRQVAEGTVTISMVGLARAKAAAAAPVVAPVPPPPNQPPAPWPATAPPPRGGAPHWANPAQEGLWPPPPAPPGPWPPPPRPDGSGGSAGDWAPGAAPPPAAASSTAPTSSG